MPVSASEAGQRLAEYLRRSKMQQKELARAIGIEPSYVSRMVKGHINWTTGQYFGKIASHLHLQDKEIKELNQAAVIEMISIKDNEISKDEYTVLEIPTELKLAAAMYADIDAKIADIDVQLALARAGSFRGGPITPQDWIQYFNDVRFWINRV